MVVDHISFLPVIYAFDPPADNAGTDIEAEWLWYRKRQKGSTLLRCADG